MEAGIGYGSDMEAVIGGGFNSWIWSSWGRIVLEREITLPLLGSTGT
jgi:hypothetical protein